MIKSLNFNKNKRLKKVAYFSQTTDCSKETIKEEIEKKMN